MDRRSQAISELITNVSSISKQLTGVVNDNQEQMRPTLDKLNSVVALLQKNKDNLAKALDGLAPYATTLGEAVGSGPYFQAYVQNLSSPQLQVLADTLVWPQHVPDSLRHYLLEPPPSIQLKDRGPR